ncbi:MAG: serine dehydratase subunit alpha family protein [Clostridia bacterium]|nr:serine dehydratase subunit alpha family protein [Clostridia bacterium]
MGCTEPIALAYGAAILREALGAQPEVLDARVSGNIIKNVKSVVVPMTGGLRGIEVALCAGLLSGQPSLRLEVLRTLGGDARDRIAALQSRCRITLAELDTPHAFDFALDGQCGTHRCHVRITDFHTNVVSVVLDGEELAARYACNGCTDAAREERAADRGLLTVENIVTYAEECDLAPLRPVLRRQIEMNTAIAREGLRGEYGAAIGKLLYRDGQASLKDRARAYATAGSDARMSGCELPVCILSGSGNQGMTASLPVIVYARELGVDEDTLLRALIVSDLITVHQKTGIGTLSAYCGAISAGCGCGAGICYLYGGRFYEIAHTVVNAVAILSGTICDGAKPSCAAKIAMAVEAGIMGFEMIRTGRQFFGGDGIVQKGIENTIRNVGRLARDGMSETDRQIIRMMLGEEDV